MSFSGKSLQHSEETGNVVFDKHYKDLWDRYQQQNRMQEAGAVLAPLLAVRSLSMSLAGTDFDQHRQFAISAENYRRQFISLLNGDLVQNAAGKSTYLRGNDFWSRIPGFHYEAPGVAAVLSNRLPSILLLTLWFCACGWFAWMSAAKLRTE